MQICAQSRRVRSRYVLGNPQWPLAAIVLALLVFAAPVTAQDGEPGGQPDAGPGTSTPADSPQPSPEPSATPEGGSDESPVSEPPVKKVEKKEAEPVVKKQPERRSEESRTETAREPLRKEPAPAPQRNEPVAEESPAGAPGGPAAPVPATEPAEAMVDALPSFDRRVLPEYESLEPTTPSYPHLDSADDEPEPPAPQEAGDDGATASGDGGSWFGDLFESIGRDPTVRNGLIVILLIVGFVVYRLRTGGSRKGYF